MPSFMSYFCSRGDPEQSVRRAIVELRQLLRMIEKKEKHLTSKIEIEVKKAETKAVSNKPGEPADDSPPICAHCASRLGQ
jgi:hypothetical protein